MRFFNAAQSQQGIVLLNIILVSLSLLMNTGVHSNEMSAHVNKNPVAMNLDEPTCNFVVEVFHLQDFSASFYDDLGELEQHLPIFLSDLNTTFPGSLYGVGTFVDKPIPPFGQPYEGPWFEGDWCLNVTSPVSSTDPQIITDILISGVVGAGFDDPENQIGALHDIALNAELVGWTDRVVNENGYPVMRVISLSTDASYHVGGEGVSTLPNLMRPNDGDKVTDCSTEDYPFVDQVRTALLHRNAYTIILVGSEEEETLEIYQSLLNTMDVYGAAYRINDDSSDFITGMQIAFNQMADNTCSKPALDIVFSHDVTFSYKNDLPILQDRIAILTENLQNDYIAPRFALTTFGDKPMFPLGHMASGDYCYRLRQTLTYSRQELLDSASGIKTTSGVDWKESQLDGMMSSVYEPTMDWRVGDTWNGFDMLRVAVLASDSGYHIAPDALTNGYTLLPHAGFMVNCMGEEYPSVADLAAALLTHGVHPLFVPTKDVAGIYRRLLKELEDDHGIIGAVSVLDDFGDMTEVVPKGLRRLKAKLEKKKQHSRQQEHKHNADVQNSSNNRDSNNRDSNNRNNNNRDSDSRDSNAQNSS
eukprot:Lankesteria_metandrocarpae@DN3672_c0_g1_i1.p1